MATPDELLNDAIAKAIDTPQSFSVAGESVTERPVNDLLLLEKMLAAKRAKRCNGFGIKWVSVEFPGSQR